MKDFANKSERHDSASEFANKHIGIHLQVSLNVRIHFNTNDLFLFVFFSICFISNGSASFSKVHRHRNPSDAPRLYLYTPMRPVCPGGQPASQPASQQTSSFIS